MIRIIGAGFSGLSLAYHFTKLNIPVVVVDKEKVPGGVIHSRFDKDMLVESAANGVLSSKKIEELFSDVGITPLFPRTDSKKKYIFRSGLRRWPLTIMETLALIANFARAFLTRKHKSVDGENLKSWATRVLGEPGCLYLIQPMVNGIFAQKTEALSARMVLGSLFYKREPGLKKGLITAPGGMGEVISKLQAFLLEKGVKFEYETSENFNLHSMQHNTFLAIDLFSLDKPLLDLTTSLGLSKQISLHSLSLVRVSVNFTTPVQEIDGFGVLFPNVEGFNSLGVLANTKIFDHRGVYNESWIFSDSTTPTLMANSDQEILQKISTDRKRIFNSAFEIKDYVIHRWPQVIPDYNNDLAQFLNSYPELVSRLTGNYLGVLGLAGIHERNFELANSYIKSKGS